MNGRLELRLRKDLAGAGAVGGVVASVYAFDTDGRRDRANDLRNIVVPAGSAAGPLTVDVAPGAYLVEVMLPSGEIASDEVLVEAGGTALADLQPAGPPHEWLTWQQLVGNAPSAAPADRPRPAATRPGGRRASRPAASLMDEWSDSLRAIRRDQAVIVEGAEPEGLDGSEPPITPPPSVAWIDAPVAALAGPPRGGGGGDAWDAIERATAAPNARTALAEGATEPTLVQPSRADGRFGLAYLGADGVVAGGDDDPGRRGPVPRRYVVAETADGTAELACVPVPWDGPDGTRVPVELLVRAAALPGESLVSLSPRDPRVGPALGYMAAGSLATARVLVDDARDLLFGKMTNALAAAAGGYILLATEQGTDRESWHGWIRNLGEWFDWLPDGAILDGTRLLRHRRGQADVAQARAALFAAYDRGLPVYSLGLQWLVDGLALLASADDVEARRRLASVQRVAYRANLQQPFTTLRLRGR